MFKILQQAEVTVNINKKAISEFIEKELQKHINQQLLLVDINKLSHLTSISKRYLEEHILPDPRVKQFERKKNRKRWWIWDNNGIGVKYAIIDILDEW